GFRIVCRHSQTSLVAISEIELCIRPATFSRRTKQFQRFGWICWDSATLQINKTQMIHGWKTTFVGGATEKASPFGYITRYAIAVHQKHAQVSFDAHISPCTRLSEASKEVGRSVIIGHSSGEPRLDLRR